MQTGILESIKNSPNLPNDLQQTKENDLSNTKNIHFITKKQIKEISKCDDLEKLNFVEICVDTNKLCLGNFGSFLPALKLLKLSNSIIPNIRDIGSAFDNLEVLWMSHCFLRNIDGLECLKNIKELYIAFNEISDIRVCGLLVNLEILDLESNQIEDESNINFLKACSNLTHLTLENNPMIKGFRSFSKYWIHVKNQLPNLQWLDNISSNCSVISQTECPTEYNFEENWSYINQLLKEFKTVNFFQQTGKTNKTEKTAEISQSNSLSDENDLNNLSMDTTTHQLISDENQFKLNDNLTTTVSEQPTEINQPLLIEEKRWADGTSLLPSENSQLTCGDVVCGDISMALRKRRSLFTNSKFSMNISKDSLPIIRGCSAKLNDLTFTVSQETSKSSNSTPRSRPSTGTVSECNLDECCLEKSVDSGLDISLISCSDPHTEIDLDPGSLDDLQHDCEKVLEELQLWRRDFLKKSKKNKGREAKDGSVKAPINFKTSTERTVIYSKLAETSNPPLDVQNGPSWRSYQSDTVEPLVIPCTNQQLEIGRRRIESRNRTPTTPKLNELSAKPSLNSLPVPRMQKPQLLPSKALVFGTSSQPHNSGLVPNVYRKMLSKESGSKFIKSPRRKVLQCDSISLHGITQTSTNHCTSHIRRIRDNTSSIYSFNSVTSTQEPKQDAHSEESNNNSNLTTSLNSTSSPITTEPKI